MKEELQAVHALIKDSRQHSARKEMREALEKIGDACRRADGLDDDDVAVLDIRTAAWAEQALLLQRLGGGVEARRAYAAAEHAARQLPTDSGRPHHRLQLATVLINLCGLLAKQRLFGEAREKVDEALGLIREISGVDAESGDPLRLLLLGALQNAATIEMEDGAINEAEALLAEAVDVGAALMTAGVPQILPQVVDVTGRLSAVQRRQGHWSESIATAERAARWSEAAYEAGSPVGVGLYVNTQLALVDANFGASQLAQAEDHLWKAIDTSDAPDTMLVGAGFYLALLRKADEALDAGGLPRGEVVDALEEILGRLEGSGAPESVLRVLRARYAVLVDGHSDHGERLLGSPPDASGSEAHVVRQLLTQLRSDVDWRKAQGAEGLETD